MNNLFHFHKKRDWEFFHRGKHDHSLCERIEELVEAVDFMHARHGFISHFLGTQQHVSDRVKKVLYKKERQFEKSAKKAQKSLKRYVKRSKRDVKKIQRLVKKQTLEVMCLENIIQNALINKKRRLAINEAKEKLFNRVQQAGEFAWEALNDNIVEPLVDVVQLDIWGRLGRRATKTTTHAFRLAGLTAVIFGITYAAVNMQALTDVGVHYMKTDSFMASHFETKELQETYVVEESLEAPPEDLVLANQERYQSDVPVFLPLDIDVTPDQNQIIIPRIGKNIPVVNVEDETVLYSEDPQDVEDAIQEALKGGVVRYPGTAVPGQQGNVFLTGHSSYYLWAPGKYKDVFALLHEVQLDDEIIVYHGEKRGDQEKFVYKVTEIKEVAPNEVEILEQTNDYRLTLMTCTPLGTSLRRLVVTATQVE